jgi:hypothetical protein
VRANRSSIYLCSGCHSPYTINFVFAMIVTPRHAMLYCTYRNMADVPRNYYYTGTSFHRMKYYVYSQVFGCHATQYTCCFRSTIITYYMFPNSIFFEYLHISQIIYFKFIIFSPVGLKTHNIIHLYRVTFILPTTKYKFQKSDNNNIIYNK